MSKFKILVVYHKKAPMFKNEVLEPIHAGRSCADEASKDGMLPRDDYDWLCRKMIGDDTGGGQNNISHLNRDINEWSVIYWAWKNYEKLGNPDYIGLMHYRRLFDFRGVVNTDRCSYAGALGLKKKYLKKIFTKYDFVYRNGFHVKDKTLHTFEPYQLEAKLSDDNHPLLYNEYLKFNAEQIFYPNNIFIMKKDDFFGFCKESFDLMMEILCLSKEERMKTFVKWVKDNCSKDRYDRFYQAYKKNKDYQPRHISYLMEYVSSFYFMYLRDKYKDRALECKILFTEPPKFISLHRHKVIKLLVKVLVNGKKYKKFKKDPNSFFADSKSRFIKILGKYYN